MIKISYQNSNRSLTLRHDSPSQDFEQLSDAVEVLRLVDEPGTATNTLTTEIMKHNMTTVKKQSIDSSPDQLF